MSLHFFPPDIHFMIDTTTNGKFQHIDQLEFWNVDQQIQSIFWCVSIFFLQK